MRKTLINGRKILRTGAWASLIVVSFMLMASCVPTVLAGKPNPPPTTNYFNTTTVDSKGWVGGYNRIATDSNGHSHIVYYDYSLHAVKYATDVTGTWKVETLSVVGSRMDDPRGGVADILVDSNNVVHIVYINANHNLVYTKKVSGIWTSNVIFPGRSIECQPSLAIDATGNLHFSYIDFTAQETPSLRYASFSNDIWTNVLIVADLDLRYYSSLAIGPNGIAHVVYFLKDEYKLRYTTNADNWISHLVDPDNYVGRYANIAVDAEGIIYLAYSVYTANPFEPVAAYLNVKFAHGTVDNWEYHLVDDTKGFLDQWTLIAVDGVGVIHIVYNVYTENLVDSGSVRYVTYTGETKSVIRTVEGSSGSGYYLDMAVGPLAQPKVHISFVNDARIDLKCAVSI